jgi:cell division protein FtsQ
VVTIHDDDMDDLEDLDDTEDEVLPRRRWPWTIALVLVGALIVGAIYIVGFSPVLALRTVVVTGSGADTLATEVRSAVGLADGTPLALVSLGEVRDRVAAVGPVASVTVARQWPHTLVVTVTARAPVAVTQANGRWWLLDATGKPYQPVASPPANLMPIDLSTPAEGDRATVAALGVLLVLPPDVRSTVAAVSAPTAYDISLHLKDGRTVTWGSNTDNALKVRVLQAVLARPGHVYDISDPTLVTVR